MGFFKDWKNNKNDKKYINAFLTNESIGEELFHSQEKDELDAAYEVLSTIAIDAFIEEVINISMTRNIMPNQVPQFSQYANGAYRLSELLEFEPDGMDFVKIGYQLCNSKHENAKRKYGENHSKLARCFGIVEIKRTRPVIVCSTSWGKYLLQYNVNEREEIFKKILCREPLIQKAIHLASVGKVDYEMIVDSLSKTTARRRRSNIKELLVRVLKNSNYVGLYDNISWFER